jgi:hypothetical protein
MSGTPISTATAPPSGAAPREKAPARKSLSAMRAKTKASVSREAQRCAAAILEVLAGVRTPTEAAAAMSVSVPRYYLWEQRALEGLVRACEPRPQGKGGSERHQIARLEKELARLRQDCARQQALVRASQRTIGLAPPPQAAAKPAAKPSGKVAAGTGAPACGSRSAGPAAAGKAKRKRRPVARALTAAAALQASSAESETLADSSSAGHPRSGSAAGVVQRSVPSSSLAAVEPSSGEHVVAPAAMPKA